MEDLIELQPLIKEIKDYLNDESFIIFLIENDLKTDIIDNLIQISEIISNYKESLNEC